jgi:hypothetical protein
LTAAASAITLSSSTSLRRRRVVNMADLARVALEGVAD